MATEIVKFEIDADEWIEFNNAFKTLSEYNAKIAEKNVVITKGNKVEGVDVPLIKEKTKFEVEAINLKALIDGKKNEAREKAARLARVKSNVTITVTE